ncbi:histone-lysine N-methyltransferase SETMAR [Trichonephila clavipes]|nr:histone-lysine N-methyltransferase SETMAR [Trichonephila clavipes]
MREEKVHLSPCMLFEFQKVNNAMETKENLWDVFGEEAITDRTCQKWLVKFCLDDFSLKDEPRSGWPSDASDEVPLSMIRTNSALTSPEVCFKLRIHQTTTLDCLKKIGFVSKPSVWMPRELSEKNLMSRVSMSSSNRARHKRELFGDNLITGEEKWIGKQLYMKSRHKDTHLKLTYIRRRLWCVVGETASV